MEDGTSGALPTKEEEFRPFVRRLPEFKFWYSSTKAIFIAFVCTWFRAFDLPVFWPVLVVYWLILFALTSKSHVPTFRLRILMFLFSETTNPAHDQVPLRPIHCRQSKILGQIIASRWLTLLFPFGVFKRPFCRTSIACACRRTNISQQSSCEGQEISAMSICTNRLTDRLGGNGIHTSRVKDSG